MPGVSYHVRHIHNGGRDMDLFEDNGEPDYQDKLRAAMIADHQAFLDKLRAAGIRPPWKLEDYTLQIDEARLLSLVADAGGLDVSKVVVDVVHDDDGLFPTSRVITKESVTIDLGMKADGNAAAVINRCIDNGWLTRVDGVDGYKLNMTADGMSELENYEDAKEWGDD